MRDTPADAVFILGDLFEVWVGDDMRRARLRARAASRCSQRRRRGACVAFMAGNRDFLVGDAMLAACGVHALPTRPCSSPSAQRVLLTHGDALCLDDVDYQRFRAQVRDPAVAARLPARSRSAERSAIGARAAAPERAAASRASRRDYADVDADAALALAARRGRGDAGPRPHAPRRRASARARRTCATC